MSADPVTGYFRALPPPYRPAHHPAPTDLDLSGAASFAASAAVRYPDARTLECRLAARFGVPDNQVIVTAGADDALERICRAAIEPGRNAVITEPTFEMIARYIATAGGGIRYVEWDRGPFPVDDAVAAADVDTRLVIVVSPNNPTGAVADIGEIRRLHDALPGALAVVDLAYVEFADADPTSQLLSLPRTLVLRTFSKAWARPDLRVGYAVGAPGIIAAMRAVGSPYPVAAASISTAMCALDRGETEMRAGVAAVRQHRYDLEGLLNELGAGAVRSQASFVCVAGPQVEWMRDALAGLGIATRMFRRNAASRLRITVPPGASDYARVREAVASALVPEVLLFDMDGVLVDVSRSCREAIRRTARQFGVTLSADAINARKAVGHANDDWTVTAELIEGAGAARPPLDAVAEAFERIYNGGEGTPGLREQETLLVDAQWIRRLAGRYPLAVVTGRPRVDAERFLTRAGLSDAFRVVVAREDAPLKPSAEPVRTALRRLDARRAWMLGDTPDDIVASRAAGVIPIGVAPPANHAMRDALWRAGASRIVTSAEEIDSCLS